MINTIPNRHPELSTRITLTTPIADLCPHSHEPQPGSTLAITYDARAVLIELHGVTEWLQTQLSEALDLETLCQRAAAAAAAAVGGAVTVEATYILANNLRLTCSSSSALPAINDL